jgi:hypothetical protein
MCLISVYTHIKVNILSSNVKVARITATAIKVNNAQQEPRTYSHSSILVVEARNITYLRKYSMIKGQSLKTKQGLNHNLTIAY